MKKTFAELGTPFPLFDAPADDASEFAGAGECSLCRQHADVCFTLGIGCGVMRECPACGAVTGLDADDAEDVGCRACKRSIPFPDLPEEIKCCYACLREGRAALTKDTELGMVSWEQAFEGLTHGLPGLSTADFELVPTESEWVRVRLTPAIMFELLRTPTYSSIQGERWLFCCRAPMTFIGVWSRERFQQEAPNGDGRTLFDSLVEGVVPGLWEDELHDTTGIYLFRCGTCGRRRGHWDIA
jgi:uncharacterized protein CbrC (UPF0167 family)